MCSLARPLADRLPLWMHRSSGEDLATQQDGSIDLTTEPLALAELLGATRSMYQVALVESADARKQLERDITVQRLIIEEANSRFVANRTKLGSFEDEWLAKGGAEGGQPAVADPANLAEAEAIWTAAFARCNDRINEYWAAQRIWIKQRKPLFKKPEPPPRLPSSFFSDLLVLRRVADIYDGLRTRAVEGQVAASTAALKTTFEAAADARDRLTQEKLGSNIAEISLSVDLLGPIAAPWDIALAQPLQPRALPRRVVRVGNIASGLPHPYAFDVPCVVEFPNHRGLAIEANASERDRALELVRSLVLRTLLDTPPGGLELTLIDPTAIGQTFADFVHLADYDERLIDTGVKTSQHAIERSLAEHAAHLETVISKYLRGQFDTIHEYNRHAGELAEPYRLLVLVDYPRQFSERACEQLLSLVENGPRCGIYTLILSSPDDEQPRGLAFSRLTQSMDLITWQGPTAQLQVGTGKRSISFTPDSCPSIRFSVDRKPTTPAAHAIEALGSAAKRGLNRNVLLDDFLPAINRNRSGVLPDFASDAPSLTLAPNTWWTASTAETAVAPIGRSGAQSIASMYFSSTTVAGGAIMVGLPRSGKTTSLHAMILTMAMLYPPEELELYLIDAKHGVEFKVYETLPHARMVSVRSEREFSLAVLKSLQSTIRDRAELFKKHGSGLANITEYRKATGHALPRIVVVIDEFHEIFEEPDNVGLDAFAAFSDIVKMGSFSGIHLVVASQTLSSMPAMDRQTLTLLPQRVAFMCNEYDAEIVMGDTNRAPRMLSKTGEGLFNPSRGDEAKNQPFQGLYVRPDERLLLLRELRDKAADRGWDRVPRVFDGDAVVARPSSLPALRAGSRFAVQIGEPFTLAESESVAFARTGGANLLLLGDRVSTEDDDGQPADLAVRGVIHSVLVAAQARRVDVTVVDFVGDEDPPHGLSVMELAKAVGSRYVRSSQLEAVLRDYAAVVAARTAADEYDASANLLVLFGLQRARSLTPYQPSYGDDDMTPSAAQLLASVLTNGPEVGVHVVVDVDRAQSAEQRLGRDLLSELNLRIAGSLADRSDLAFATGAYGDLPPLRAGQLMLGDLVRGTSKRVRGYDVITTAPPTIAPLITEDGP